MLKESLGQLICASCHLKEKSSFSLRTHLSIFTSAAPKLFERYNLTKCVLWHIMDISPSQCLGKLKSSKTSRKNLSEVVSRRKVEQTAQVQNYPHNKYYHATAVLRLRSLCNQGKNYYPHLYLEECKNKHSLSSDSFDWNLLRCKTFYSNK